VRVERWLRAHPGEDPKRALAGKLDASWQDAVAAADLKLAARVLEARQIWLGEEAAPATRRADVEKMVRAALERYLRDYGKDWRNGRLPLGVVALTERFGVPSGVDLDATLDAARRYYRETVDSVMPLPHPYNMNIRIQRLQRLRVDPDK